jgi:hypothetical protein
MASGLTSAVTQTHARGLLGELGRRAAGRPQMADLSYAGATRQRLWLPWGFRVLPVAAITRYRARHALSRRLTERTGRELRDSGSLVLDADPASATYERNGIVNSIIWLVGLVVIILAALSFFGLR